MINDPWALARSPRWRFTLLDSEDVPVRDISSSVQGGSLEIVTLSTLGGSGNIQITERGDSINFLANRLGVEYDPGVAGLEPLPMGVWLFSDPKVTYRDGVKLYDVPLLTKVSVPSEDAFAASYSLPAGTVITEAVRDILASSGEYRVTVTERGATTTNPLVWEAGTSKLSIINDLLTSANYTALWVDGSGVFRLDPYVPPGDRAVTRTFEAGQVSIHSPEWTREQAITGVPNQVTVVCAGDDETPAIVGLAQNLDPDSPYSIPSRNGRVVNRTEEVSDIDSQTAADDYAARLLAGGLTPTATLEVSHAIVPMNPADLVVFVSDGLKNATVRRMAYELTYNSQCKATWVEL